MLFNSFPFFIFFFIVFFVYFLPVVRSRVKLQNLWLLLASYFFYGYADIAMIPLLLATTVVFYIMGLWLKSTMQKGKEKAAYWISTLGVCLGIGVLLYFKYLGFFAESFALLFNKLGLGVSWSTLNIVMPIGVSFFTFKLISYIIEIHREHIEPCKDFVEFATFVAFFPTILSGPIDRPNKFLPQLAKNRVFDGATAIDGARQFLWGLFTKLCIADSLATITDSAWANMDDSSASTLLLSAIIYPLQLYADFDGYSNMAIGVGKILNIKVARNFNHPFLARNIAEFWRGWHMSLTGWLTDYVFAPLNIAFRNLENLGIIFAIVINFILIGFWHGANWTYALFGLYQGLLYIPLILSGGFGKRKKLRPAANGLPFRKDVYKMIGTYALVALGLVIFRAPSMSAAFQFIGGWFSTSLLSAPQFLNVKVLIAIAFALMLLVLDWVQRDKEYSSQNNTLNLGKMIMIDVFLMALIVFLGAFGGNQFIYFQF